MILEIDQSGKIEETNRDTIIAIANYNKHFSLRIYSKTKRALEKDFRKLGKPKMFKIKIFAYSVAFLIKKTNITETDFKIDIEYPGHEKLISNIIRSKFEKNYYIRFGYIGKNSPAHKIAYFTYKKKYKADFVLTYKEMVKYSEGNF